MDARPDPSSNTFLTWGRGGTGLRLGIEWMTGVATGFQTGIKHQFRICRPARGFRME